MKNIFLSLILLSSISGFCQWEQIPINSEIDINDVRSFQLIDNNTVALVSSSRLMFGCLDCDDFQVLWHEVNLPLQDGEQFHYSSGTSYFKDTISGILLVRKESDYRIIRKSENENWLSIPLPGIDDKDIQKIYEFDNNRIVVSTYKSVHYTDDFGLTWISNTFKDISNDPLNVSLVLSKFYPNGIGFLSNYDFELYFTNDYGDTWSKVSNSNDINASNDYAHDAFYVDNEIYVGMSISPYLPFTQQIQHLDTVTKELTPISPNSGEIIFLSPNHIYQKTPYEFEGKLDIEVLFNDRFYSSLKDEIELSTGMFTSYSNTGSDYVILTSDRIVKYNPQICQDIVFNSISTPENSSTTIHFENNTGELLIYSGAGITTYIDDTLVQIMNLQTFGNDIGTTSLVALNDSDTPIELNKDYGVVIDYDLGEKSCFFGTNTGLITTTGDFTVQSEISLYPSPAINTLHITTSKEFLFVKIYDSNGKEVLQSQETTIDISILLSGIYLAKMEFLSGQISQISFIKN